VIPQFAAKLRAIRHAHKFEQEFARSRNSTGRQASRFVQFVRHAVSLS
jgi:hypothetical protein